MSWSRIEYSSPRGRQCRRRRERKARVVKFTSVARRLPSASSRSLASAASLALVVPALFLACGSDAGHSSPSEDGGASAGGMAGRNATAGAAGKGKPTAGEAGSIDDPNGEGGVAGEVAAGGGDPGGAANAGSGNGGAAANAAPSCKAGGVTAKCGPNEESCCTSLPIPGQTFFLGFDDVSADYKDKSHSASVTGFRLDKYEVTVGRFRQFVAAVVGAWRPEAGAGKHSSPARRRRPEEHRRCRRQRSRLGRRLEQPARQQGRALEHEPGL